MKKLAVIRGHEISCPYGLDITKACHNAGESVRYMKPAIDEKGDEITDAKKSNKIIYLTQKTDKRCPFANDILDEHEVVNCSWDGVSMGEGSKYISPSPLYPRTYIGDGVDPTSPSKMPTMYDPREFTDAPEKGYDVPFGLFSVFAEPYNERQLIKLAYQHTNNSVIIEDKLANLKGKYLETLKAMVGQCKAAKLKDEHLKYLLTIINEWT